MIPSSFVVIMANASGTSSNEKVCVVALGEVHDVVRAELPGQRLALRPRLDRDDAHWLVKPRWQ
jgi:hypothetical protein